MEEVNQTRGVAGRPESKVKKKDLPLAIDPVTYRMLETLEGYGRFGTSKQEVLLFIVRSWFWENEARLKAALSSAETPLGAVASEQE